MKKTIMLLSFALLALSNMALALDKARLDPAIDASRAFWGPQDAPITIVEYSDFQCGYCVRASNTIKSLAQKYEGKIRLLYKHLPLQMHNQALPAAQWFEAIALTEGSEKAYQFHDLLFGRASTQRLTPEFFKTSAQSLGLDVANLEKELGSDAVKARIDADVAETTRLGIKGTPNFVINGYPVRGAAPQEQFERVIDAILAQPRNQ